VSDSQTFIFKADGSRVLFEIEKLKNSLRHAGAGQDDIQAICEIIEKELVDGTNTKHIYQKAFQILKRRSEGIASRYKLKRAITELGPSGYPFEQYIAEIFRHQGYEVETNVFMQGKCIQHEIDVRATKGTETLLIECKFHNNTSAKSDVKVPLYMLSRFNDIADNMSGNGQEYSGWIITNTRFTEEAEKFGECAPLKLISWDYPEKGSLKERIELSGLHPITCLVNLSKKQKEQLLKKRIVIGRNLLNEELNLQKIGLSETKIKRLKRELMDLSIPTERA